MINLHEWVFQKAEIARAASASAISAFFKNSRVQINHKLNSKPYDYLLIIIHEKIYGEVTIFNIADMK